MQDVKAFIAAVEQDKARGAEALAELERLAASCPDIEVAFSPELVEAFERFEQLCAGDASTAEPLPVHGIRI